MEDGEHGWKPRPALCLQRSIGCIDQADPVRIALRNPCSQARGIKGRVHSDKQPLTFKSKVVFP
jgi:hypothetical protein